LLEGDLAIVAEHDIERGQRIGQETTIEYEQANR
jgi:hypothetical protein